MGDRWFLTPGGALLYGDGSGGATPYGVASWGEGNEDDQRRALAALGALAKRALLDVPAADTATEPGADEYGTGITAFVAERAAARVHVEQDAEGNWYEVPCDCDVSAADPLSPQSREAVDAVVDAARSLATDMAADTADASTERDELRAALRFVIDRGLDSDDDGVRLWACGAAEHCRALLDVPAADTTMPCPDGGTCDHECVPGAWCWRIDVGPAADTDTQDEPDALPSRVPCHNRRHHHQLAHGARCFPIVPQDRPIPDRVVGTAAVLAVTGLGVAFCVGWAAGEWLATEGRVRLEVARAQAYAARRRSLG